MSNSTQCVKPPASGASGSCMISTNYFAFAGASVHASAGDGFCCPASQVYFDGMLPSLVNAGLVRLNAPAMMRTPIMLMLLVLVVGHWSLVVGHWSLVVGHWSLVVGRWSSGTA